MAATPLPGGDEHILLVDDEESVARVVSRMLEESGYRVTVFHRPVAAREFLRDTASDVDMLLTDLSMPELTGRDLARAVLADRPELPVILYSGFPDSIPAETLREIGIRAILAKPFSQIRLARTVRAVLDASGEVAESRKRGIG